jgi:hypothetical protein
MLLQTGPTVKACSRKPVLREAMQVVGRRLAGLAVSRELMAKPASVLLAVASRPLEEPRTHDDPIARLFLPPPCDFSRGMSLGDKFHGNEHER